VRIAASVVYNHHLSDYNTLDFEDGREK
jgi:uncharacterized protein affecting Mg2+/Co2+ transport